MVVKILHRLRMPYIRGGCVIHNKDIIESYIYYDKLLADGSKGSYSNKNCTS